MIGRKGEGKEGEVGTTEGGVGGEVLKREMCCDWEKGSKRVSERGMEYMWTLL